MGPLTSTRLMWWLRVSHKLKLLITLRPLQFVPITKMNYLRLVLAFAPSQCWSIFQMDVKSASCMEICKKRSIWSSLLVLLRMHHLFVDYGTHSMVSNNLLKPGIIKMDSFILSTSFIKCHSNTTVYIWRDGEDLTILILYVDVLFLNGISSPHIQIVQRPHLERFEMTDLR